MRKSFDAMRQSLLEAGVAPRHVHRYIAELQDHLADVTVELRQSAGDEAAARSQALARLGEFDRLTDAMRVRPELRAWITRSVWRFAVLLPIAGILAVLLIECLAVLALADYNGPNLYSPWLQTAGIIFTYAGPVLGQLGVMGVGRRYRRPLAWTMPAVIVAGMTGGLIHWYGASQSIGFGLDLNPVSFAMRTLPIMVLSLSAMLLWHAHSAKRLRIPLI